MLQSACAGALRSRPVIRLLLEPGCGARALTTSAIERLRSEGAERGGAAHVWPWPVLAAAGLAAFAANATTAACKEYDEDDGSVGKHRVALAWEQVCENLHRDEAAFHPRLAAAPEPVSPEVSAAKGQVVVRIPVRRGVDLSSLLAGIAGAFAHTLGGSLTAKVRDDVDSRVIQFESSARPSGGGLLQALLVLPKRQPGAQPLVEIRKIGPLTDEDLAVIAAAMRSANSLTDQVEQPGTADFFSLGESGDAFAQLFGDMQRLFSFGPGSLFERHMAEQMQRLFEPGRMDGWNRDTEEGFALPPPRGAVQETPMGRLSREWQQQQGQQQGQVAPGGALQQGGTSESQYGSREADQAAARLMQLGATVNPPGNKEIITWDRLAGYEDQKRQIEDTVLLALLHPEVCEEVARGTRAREAESTRPRAVLFEGPPGCGKTTSAKVIASQAAVPLVYVPLEAVASKWYGESERNLSEIFRAAEQLGGAIVFLDEIDSLATQRSSDMHEATRRLLGVLLRQLDGYGPQGRSIVIGATNRRQDLDPALLSRFDAAISFGYPSEDSRRQILKQYAQHLSDSDIATLAAATSNARVSGRDLRDIAEQTERKWASQIVRGQRPKGHLPDLAAYLEGVQARLAEKGTPDARAICAGCVDCEYDNNLNRRMRDRATETARTQGRAAVA